MRISDWSSDVCSSDLTVDERVRKVLKKLNVANRIEAAQFLADNGAFDYAIPQPPLRYQLANLANATPTAEGHHNGARGIFDIGAPFPTATQPVNRHRGMERIIWPILIAFATVLAFSGLYSILSGISRVTQLSKCATVRNKQGGSTERRSVGKE